MGASTTEFYRNAEWSVRADGLEHDNGYFIDRGTVAARREERLWDWPLQMAEKRWCRPSLFREAFLVALDRFGVARDADLNRSFALGYGIRAADAPAGEGMIRLSDLLDSRGPAAPAPARTPARAHVRGVPAAAGA